MRTTKQTLNTRKTIENSKCRTTAILGCAAAGLFQMMGEVKCDASIKNPFKTGNEPEVIIRKAVTALIITGIIAAVNWLTWGLLANPILGLLIIFAGVYYEIDRQEKEKSTIRIKL
ncbi:unnamed protein product [Acanthoscelides obtectus]|uniref:Uncharacterized protein n=1 Tax=Acanthoscelides obtectus TaxID=200917 RepID=A0A9P0LKQ9_ACAOB|nr:unnamed protein product [Acanthoscelides obtectus]CAK1640601.1 hypothetical protein AOBTE_LOCUS11820 [Acanthoscelides obtectus]